MHIYSRKVFKRFMYAEGCWIQVSISKSVFRYARQTFLLKSIPWKRKHNADAKRGIVNFSLYPFLILGLWISLEVLFFILFLNFWILNIFALVQCQTYSQVFFMFSMINMPHLLIIVLALVENILQRANFSFYFQVSFTYWF